MPGPFIPKTARERVSPHRLGDNGASVSGAGENLLATKINQALRYQRKEVFGYSSIYDSALASSATARVRWRSAFHSGVLATRLVIRAVMKPADATTSGPYAVFAVADDAGRTSSVQMDYGGQGTTTVPALEGYGFVRVTLDIRPDTNYTASFTDYDGAILVSACVHEESATNETGYIDSSDLMRPVYSTTRQQMMESMDDLWALNASHVFNFTVDTDDNARFMTNSSTARNVIDDSSTTVTAATPGYTIDLRYKNRRSKTTVPCVFRVCGYADTSGRPGAAYLLNSSGTALATVVIGHNASAAPVWWSALVDLPATEAKYDIHFAGYGTSSPSNRTYFYACSLYEFDGSVPSAPGSGDAAAATRFWTTRIPRRIRRRGGNRR